MIELARRLFPGRVARRVFLLFVLSAFIPLGLVAVLSLAQVRDVLLEEGEQRLAARSKAYGNSVLERLLLASEAAAGAMVYRDRAWHAPAALSRYFASLGMVDAKGRMTAVLGRPDLPTVPAALQRRLASGKHAIVFEPSQPLARVYLLVPDFNIAPGTVLFGELLPDFLWGPQDILPAATEFCVVDDETRATLYCSEPFAGRALRAMEAPSGRPTARSVTWEEGSETLRAVAWPQFMRAEFGIGEWLVIASQPERFQLRRVAEFRKIFLPVVLLALLIVAWLSVRQIRATLVPVDELAAGARRVAQNDFSTQVDVRRDDEFGELASAFNHMSARLGRQFSALTALAEIDHLILSSVDTEWVIRTVLERIGEVAPADCASITLLDHDNPGLAHTYAREAGPRGRVTALRHDVPTAERKALEASPRGFWTALAESPPGYLSRQRADGMAAAYVQPITWRESVCGALVLAFRAMPTLGDEDRKQVGEFADRVAVAISSAWRDEQLYVQAHFDALTGLPNRSLLKDRLSQEIARCQREAGSFSLLFIDLDHFKNVNDTLGHASGDAALKEAARRISGCLRESDTVSRLGGDEFNVILTQVQHSQDPARVAEHIVKALSEPFVIEGQSSFLSASIGIALYPQDGRSAEELIKNADTAMYRAKSGGRAQAVYFEEAMNAEAVARVTLDRELRRAIDRDELELVYQPVLDLRSGSLCGAEALLRWHHPTFGTLPPVKFIPMAEESGYIEQLGRWVLQQACFQMRQWQSEGVAPERLAVNVSPRQFRRLGLVELVGECARAAGVSPSCLEVEITETALIDHGPAVERMLRQLAARDVRISLDDFGTGFSSMAYLKRFPVHTVKIDRVFVESLDRDSDSEVIVAAIIAMSHALGKVVIAEGMETERQLELLQKLKCDRVQGFHFSRPLPAAEFAEFARAALARDQDVRAPSAATRA
jgi:diguanylate cyclase (GGDEF)-like protein